ncbi:MULTISPECIES: hypothetical protein [Nocardiopsidaceae]|uniref:HXXEE domain-containing protein n=2 Tax=Nocardiopsidaceae TaxID=83676 RepID=A0ABY6YF44_9ACTN|nr:hypothetical protein [Streptomonospora nanhaiensis]MEE2044384.1 hypothetical protein [Nocardiopsis tropica]WAE70867.1 hypothetical protein OUQ99_16635 [Streptomonospora nanhaiensis]
MAARPDPTTRHRGGLLATVNSDRHRTALWVFMAVVVAHWAEHLVQAAQIYVLDWPVPEARGVLGIPFPWLVTSEWMHYGYALIMLVGLFLLLPGFSGRSRSWWLASLWIQVWHHLEHLLLLLQALSGSHLGGGAAPMSLIQFVVPRVELHLLYNALVFAPMVVAMYLHTHPRPDEAAAMSCGCAAAREGDPVR